MYYPAGNKPPSNGNNHDNKTVSNERTAETLFLYVIMCHYCIFMVGRIGEEDRKVNAVLRAKIILILYLHLLAEGNL